MFNIRELRTQCAQAITNITENLDPITQLVDLKVLPEHVRHAFCEASANQRMRAGFLCHGCKSLLGEEEPRDILIVAARTAKDFVSSSDLRELEEIDLPQCFDPYTGWLSLPQVMLKLATGQVSAKRDLDFQLSGLEPTRSQTADDRRYQGAIISDSVWTLIVLPLKTDARSLAVSWMEKAFYSDEYKVWQNFWHLTSQVSNILSHDALLWIIVTKSILAADEAMADPKITPPTRALRCLVAFSQKNDSLSLAELVYDKFLGGAVRHTALDLSALEELVLDCLDVEEGWFQ